MEDVPERVLAGVYGGGAALVAAKDDEGGGGGGAFLKAAGARATELAEDGVRASVDPPGERPLP